MADRGAKHLAFISRSGVENTAAAETVQLLGDQGVSTSVLLANIVNRDELAHAVTSIDPTIPIRGVLNAASVFHDVLFNKMTIETWKEVVDTKVKGSLNLHEVLKHEPLDFFVMTSSVASTLGSSGQVNYSAGKQTSSLFLTCRPLL
jgi:NADP-dependent 3-hydroxy acid dehydrogenase YdfG